MQSQTVHCSKAVSLHGKTLDLGVSPAMALMCLSRWQR